VLNFELVKGQRSKVESRKSEVETERKTRNTKLSAGDE